MKFNKFLLYFTLIFTVVLSNSCAKPMQEDYMSQAQDVRLQNVMKKIRSGKEVSIVCMGGSITTGYNSNPIKTNSWAGLTEKWFKELGKKNKAKINFYNMGMSGTDSAFGVARINNHVLSKNPDLVILEYAMNDQWLEPETRVRTYEGIIRKIMNNSETAILALFVNERNAPYSSNQEEEQKICEYYHIPYVSWKDSVFAENPDADFNQFFEGTESIHPSNAGHASIASYITKKLQSIWENLPADKAIPSPVKALPEALTDTAFENVIYLTSGNTTPVENKGFEPVTPLHDEWKRYGDAKPGWQTNQQDAEIVFEVEGSTIGVTYCESDQFQDAVVWITDEDDTDLNLVVLKNYVSYRNGYYGWAYKELIHGDEVKKYKVHVGVYDCFSEDYEPKLTNITGIICAQ